MRLARYDGYGLGDNSDSRGLPWCLVVACLLRPVLTFVECRLGAESGLRQIFESAPVPTIVVLDAYALEYLLLSE